MYYILFNASKCYYQLELFASATRRQIDVIKSSDLIFRISTQDFWIPRKILIRNDAINKNKHSNPGKLHKSPDYKFFIISFFNFFFV